MEHIRNQIQNIIKDEEGANLVEYLLLLALIAIVVIAAAKTFGSTVSSKFQEKEGDVSGL